MIFGIPVPNLVLVPTFSENSRREPYFLILSNGCLVWPHPFVKLKANLLATIAQSCVSSGTNLTTQFPSHGLGEPVAYGFQTLAKGAAL